MFGSKKNQFDLRLREVFSQVAEQRESFEIAVEQMEEGTKRIENDVNQVMENTHEIGNQAMSNIEAETGLIFQMDDFSKELRGVIEEYSGLRELMTEHYEATMTLVEENKHFTSPSKYLTEAPASMQQSVKEYEKRLSDMEACGRNIGVMALNSAIEAGRLGEDGKQFVEASEEIRQQALVYERAATELQDDLQAAKAKITEMEETIHHLVALIKDNNKGTMRLLKKGQELEKALQESSVREFSEDILQMRDVIVKLRNSDEDVVKCAERNKIQLVDIQEDILQNKKTMAEVESDLAHTLDIAEAQLK